MFRLALLLSASHCLGMARYVPGEEARCPLQIDRMTATAAGPDSIEIRVTFSNNGSDCGVTFDGRPDVPLRSAEKMAGHLELYVSVDNQLNAGDWPLQIVPHSDADTVVKPGTKAAIRWLARVPPAMNLRGAKLLLVAHAGGAITSRSAVVAPNAMIVPRANDPCVTAVCGIPQLAVAAPRPRPKGTSSTTPAAPQAWQLHAREQDDSDGLALFCVYSEPPSRLLDPNRGLWGPRPGAVIVKNTGKRALEIGDGDADELVRQVYAGRPDTTDSTELILRPAGGHLLLFPQGTRFEPGDAMFLVSLEDDRDQQFLDGAPQPLASQQAKVGGIGEPELIDRYPWCIVEIKKRTLAGDRRSCCTLQLALPPNIWVRTE
jgi:hypothetical protein